MSAPRLAHALCPYCHPEDPTPGTPTTRWCGAVIPVAEAAGPDSALCPDCSAPNSSCATCGARMTFLGVMPPDPATAR